MPTTDIDWPPLVAVLSRVFKVVVSGQCRTRNAVRLPTAGTAIAFARFRSPSFPENARGNA